MWPMSPFSGDHYSRRPRFYWPSPKLSARAWLSVLPEKGRTCHERLCGGWVGNHRHSPRAGAPRGRTSGDRVDAVRKQTERSARIRGFSGCCRRAESRSIDSDSRGRASDTCRSSTNGAPKGRRAPRGRSRRDEPAAHRRHTQSPGCGNSYWRQAIPGRLVCHAFESRAWRHSG